MQTFLRMSTSSKFSVISMRCPVIMQNSSGPDGISHMPRDKKKREMLLQSRKRNRNALGCPFSTDCPTSIT